MTSSTIFTSLRCLGAAVVLSAVAALGHAQTAVKPAAAPAAMQTAKAVFAGGCFWCVEADFDKVAGVISTTSGYTGGKTANPTYEQVSAHTTGHAEAVQIEFDPAKVTYEQLVQHLMMTMNQTS